MIYECEKCKETYNAAGSAYYVISQPSFQSLLSIYCCPACWKYLVGYQFGVTMSDSYFQECCKLKQYDNLFAIRLYVNENIRNTLWICKDCLMKYFATEEEIKIVES